MSRFTGRQSSGRAKKFGSAMLEGLSMLGTAMNDGPKRERIREIDAEMERLQHEKDSLIAGLYEPGDLKVSENYDPNKTVIMNLGPKGDGRLTQCNGQSYGGAFSGVHPACPYKGEIHVAHEFTAND